jgi:hypothetical protein
VLDDGALVRQLDEALDEKAGGQQGRCIMQKFGCSGREYVCVQLAGVTGACTAHERQAEDMSNATYAEADLCPKPEVNRSLTSTGENSPVPKARRG